MVCAPAHVKGQDLNPESANFHSVSCNHGVSLTSKAPVTLAELVCLPMCICICTHTSVCVFVCMYIENTILR